jgi:hypothetical protein
VSEVNLVKGWGHDGLPEGRGNGDVSAVTTPSLSQAQVLHAGVEQRAADAEQTRGLRAHASRRVRT